MVDERMIGGLTAQREPPTPRKRTYRRFHGSARLSEPHDEQAGIAVRDPAWI